MFKNIINVKIRNDAKQEEEDLSNYVSWKERFGFYGFSLANQPYLTTVLGLATPVILESLAAGAGVDKLTGEPCNTRLASYSCNVNLAGTWYDTSSFALYTSAITVALQAIVFITIGAVADYGRLRKTLLLCSSTFSAICSLLLLTIRKNEYFWIAALLTIIANVAYGAGYVYYYAYLPILTNNTKEVVEAEKLDQENKRDVRERVSNSISGRGFAAGFLGGCINVSIASIIVSFVKLDGPVDSYIMQVICAFTGCWMLFFNLIPLFFLRERPGKPLPPGENSILYSWKQIIQTFKNVKYLSQLFLLLLSWFIMSDTYQTFLSIAVLIGKIEIGFNALELTTSAITVPLCACIGTLAFNFIRSKWNIKTKSMLITVNVLYCLISIYSLIGLSPNVNWGVKQKFEAYIVVGMHGFLIGPIQSFYRVLFAEMIPRGKESEFFSLYQITGKGSSWIGPLVVGAIVANNPIRMGFTFILVSTIASALITFFIDTNKADQQVKEFEQNLNEKAE